MRPATPPQIALLRRIAAGPVDQASLVGRECLSSKALSRAGWAFQVPVRDAAAKNGCRWDIIITGAGREVLAKAQSGNPEPARGRTTRVGYRLPVAVKPYLERGIALHGTATAAVVAALVKSYPPA